MSVKHSCVAVLMRRPSGTGDATSACSTVGARRAVPLGGVCEVLGLEGRGDERGGEEVRAGSRLEAAVEEVVGGL